MMPVQTRTFNSFGRIVVAGGADWSDLNNAAAQDGEFASVTMNDQVSYHLRASNGGFSLPSNAAVQGITLRVRRRVSDMVFPPSGVRDESVRLWLGELVGENKASVTNWPVSSAADATYGGEDDLWDEEWTPEQINSDDFGAAVQARELNGSARTGEIDVIEMSVHYKQAIAAALLLLY